MKPNGLFIILGLILVGLCAQGASSLTEHTSAMSLSDWVQNDLDSHASRNDVSITAVFPDTKAEASNTGSCLPEDSLPTDAGAIPTQETASDTNGPIKAGLPVGRTLDTMACLQSRVAMVSHASSGFSPEIGPGVNQTSKIPVSPHSISFLDLQDRTSSPIYLRTVTLLI